MKSDQSKSYRLGQTFFLYGAGLALVFTFLSGWGGWLTGGGHGTYWPFVIAGGLSVVAWLLLVASAVSAVIIKLRSDDIVWWLIPAAIVVPTLPFVWFWWVRDGFWMIY